MEMHLLFPRRYYSLYRLITSGLEKNDVAGNLSGTCFNVASVTSKVLVSVFPFSVHYHIFSHQSNGGMKRFRCGGGIKNVCL